MSTHLATLPHLRELGGRAFLGAVIKGELPPLPMGVKLGFSLTAIGEGEALLTGTPDTSVYNYVDTVHGGYAATLLDTAMACALLTQLAAGQSFTTLEIKIQYLRAITAETGEVRAKGRLVHGGRKMAVAEAQLLDGADRLLATGSTTCMIL